MQKITIANINRAMSRMTVHPVNEKITNLGVFNFLPIAVKRPHLPHDVTGRRLHIVLNIIHVFREVQTEFLPGVCSG
jgi:hypothetical protein